MCIATGTHTFSILSSMQNSPGESFELRESSNKKSNSSQISRSTDDNKVNLKQNEILAKSSNVDVLLYEEGKNKWF